MKRRAFLAGLAAIAVSSKIPPLPAPPATPAVLPALPARIPGVITTAGGWCAPSEVVYDLVQVDPRQEFADVIEAMGHIRIRRGGLTYPTPEA